MSAITDPARELADLCSELKGGGKATGSDFLASKFGVPAWSAEFFQIIFVITKRIDDLALIVQDLEMDDDFKREAISHLKAIKQAFTQAGLNNAWSTVEERFLNSTNIQPIKMLSPYVRKSINYPKLDKGEQAQLVLEIAELESWLKEHQIVEQDFIRQALLDGVSQFKFRLERVGWLGWGYTISSLRDVISAYMALERGFPDANISPDAGAILMKTKAAIGVVFEKMKFAKDAWETGDFALKAYGAASLMLQAHHVFGGLLSKG